MSDKPPAWKVPFLYAQIFCILILFVLWIAAMFVIFWLSDVFKAIRGYVRWVRGEQNP